MRTRPLAYLMLTLLIALPGRAQVRDRDPLTEKEVDQLRETAIEPEKRLKLMVEFTKARMVAIEQLRTDPKLAKDRGQKIHDLQEEKVTGVLIGTPDMPAAGWVSGLQGVLNSI